MFNGDFHAEMPLSMLKRFRTVYVGACHRQSAAWKNGIISSQIHSGFFWQ
jgi:hypothetical protein